MKIHRLEAHDRLLHLKKDQSLNISQGAEDCLKKNNLSLALQEKSSYIYLFAHPRTADDGVTKKMYWQPRLTKPEPQTNSYLFRAKSHTDVMEVCWLLPPEEMWDAYKLGNVTQHEIVLWSIRYFKENKIGMKAAEPDDLSDEECRAIYRQVIDELRQDALRKRNMQAIEDISEYIKI